jgi:hypothetical protein
VDLAAINAQITQENGAEFSVALFHNRRLCHGKLLLTQQELTFLSIFDESVAVAAGADAAARQFGLIGGLIGGVASAARSSSRDKKFEAAKEALHGLSLEQQLTRSPHSFRAGPNQVQLDRKGGIYRLHFGGEVYNIHQMEAPDFQALVAWLSCRGVDVAAA